MYTATLLLLLAAAFSPCSAEKPPGGYLDGTGQITIDRVERMPAIPRPFIMKDWLSLARECDRLLFDPGAREKFFPLVWFDDSRIDIGGPGFGLPSYVGDPRASGSNHEAIASLGAVLGATVAGIDKSAGSHNWVSMCEQYYNRTNGQNLVLNYTSTISGSSFWYELWPHILFYALADRYPQCKNFERIMLDTAEQWYEASVVMGGQTNPWTVPDFNHTAFDFTTMQPVDNDQWREPDSAAAIAWLMYMAWIRTGDDKFLAAADWGIQFLVDRDTNPLYEVLLPFGACLAARMNAERGRNYDIKKLVDWCFDGDSVCRPGWGVITGRWGGYDVSGLMGSIDDHGGYGFAMNTFSLAAALVPLARYDHRFARSVGRWMLNAANAASLFYPDVLPGGYQSCPEWKNMPHHVLCYEGLVREWNGTTPFATGDAIRCNWGPETDISVYASGYAGLFGGIIARTNDPRILRLDCLATDFFRRPAYPTYLYYNPYQLEREVCLDVGGSPRHLYDAVSGRMVRKNVTGNTSFSLPGDSAAVIVITPPADLQYHGRRRSVSGVVVDYVAPSRYAEYVPMDQPYGNRPTIDWNSETLSSAGPWTVHMNDPVVETTGEGLRLTVGGQRDWAVVAVPNVVLPDDISSIRAQATVLSGTPTWSVKLTTDLDEDGKAEDWMPFSSSRTEALERKMHSAVSTSHDRPLHLLQLAVEGPAGCTVLFNRIEFLP